MPHTPNSRLRLLLEAAGWNGSQLARAVRVVAAEQDMSLSCNRSTVSRWLAGAHPKPPASSFLIEALSRRLHRTVTVQEAGLTRAPAVVLDLSWEAAPLRRLALLTTTELDPTQRRLIGAETFSLGALVVPDLTRPAAPRPHPSSVPRPAGDRAGQEAAAQMQSMAAVFASAADQHGGSPVRAALAAYLAYEVTPWLHTPAGEGLHHQLLSRAAQLTMLLGSICANSGDDAPAQHYYQTAASLAAEAHDDSTVAIVLRTMATHAYDLGHHGPIVLNLAEQAVVHARHAPPAIRAFAQAHLAVIQAHFDRHAALTALACAERLHAQTDGPPGPFTAYPLGALHYKRAQTFSALNDFTGAIGALTASLRVRTPAEQHARTLTHARLAETLLSIGHRDAALPHWQTFLDSYPTVRNARARRRLDAMRRRLRPHLHDPAAARLLTRAAAPT